MQKQKLRDRIYSALREGDHRLTPQREAVVEVLLDNADAHLSAENIFMQTKHNYPDIGLATVYRTLELLENLGLVHRFDYGDGQSRYEVSLTAEGHYHHHLICVNCGEIGEFKDDLLDEIEEKIAAETGFVVTDHCLRLFGLCQKCQGEQDKPAEPIDK
ncbi:MAG TPA: transcriptional repressor [Firmicutes bacterium]|jgi:Fur family ferric uptake transcriptional regulator|nr:transcriptional repressor [Bacillota bacterium]